MLQFISLICNLIYKSNVGKYVTLGKFDILIIVTQNNEMGTGEKARNILQMIGAYNKINSYTSRKKEGQWKMEYIKSNISQKLLPS